MLTTVLLKMLMISPPPPPTLRKFISISSVQLCDNIIIFIAFKTQSRVLMAKRTSMYVIIGPTCLDLYFSLNKYNLMYTFSK